VEKGRLKVKWNCFLMHLKGHCTRAAGANKVAAMRVLVEEGKALLDCKDREGSTPLLVAASCGNESAAVYLTIKGANVEVGTCDQALLSGRATARSWMDHGHCVMTLCPTRLLYATMNSIGTEQMCWNVSPFMEGMHVPSSDG
jgi:hypothetical protein